MTALASNFLHASYDVRICVARAYLGALWNHGDRRGDNGCVIGTLGDGAVVEIGDGFTLGSGAVVGIGGGPTLGYGVG